MTSIRRHLTVAALTLAASACGSGASRSAGPPSWAGFECKHRRAEYMVSGGFAGPEAGVSLLCDDAGGPRLVKYLVDDEDRRHESTHGLGAGEFDALWERIDSTGWHNLTDCDNPDAAATDPVYTFDLVDDWGPKAMSCTARTLPFPWDAIVSELDQKAAEYGN